jgi:hypothetical protein
MDAVLLADAATGSAAAASESAAEDCRLEDQWRPSDGSDISPGGSDMADFFVDDAFCANAVLDLDATGSDASGESLQRDDDDDTDVLGDWTQAASSFGTLNAGQSAF